MGMYSTFVNQDIRIIDTLGMMKLKQTFKADEDSGLIQVEGGGVTIDFGAWDDHKIEGYWYDETMKVLRAIAPLIEGYAEFHYEEGYDFRIVFEDGKVLYQRAENKWGDKEELM